MNTSQPISPKPAARPERLDGTQDTDPIADRPHPNVLEQAVIELRQDVPADGVFTERFGVLGKSKGLEPFPEIGHRHSPRYGSTLALRANGRFMLSHIIYVMLSHIIYVMPLRSLSAARRRSDQINYRSSWTPKICSLRPPSSASASSRSGTSMPSAFAKWAKVIRAAGIKAE